MAFEKRITRENPICIVLLVDQSTSMADPFGGQPNKKKADGVADVINNLLCSFCKKCEKQGELYEYLEIAVIGYGKQVKSAFGGQLSGRGLISIGDVSDNPLRVETRTKLIEDGVGGVVKRDVKFPIWLEPVANGNTPMRGAFELAHTLVSEFLSRYPDCFPPQVINFTDGKPNPGDDPTAAAAALRQLRSSDGELLLWNAHLSALNVAPIMFPEHEQGLPDELAKQLFRMSSVLPPPFVRMGQQEELDIGPQSRAFAFNVDFVAMIQFLDFGTQLAKG